MLLYMTRKLYLLLRKFDSEDLNKVNCFKRQRILKLIKVIILKGIEN